MKHPRRFHRASILLCVIGTVLPGEEPRKGEKLPEPKVLLKLDGHEADVYAIRYSPDGSLLATGSFDKTIKLWDAKTGKVIAAPFAGHQGKVLGLAFSADGRSLASASEDKTVKLWDVPAAGAAAFEGHSGEVTTFALGPDQVYAATGSADGTVRIWNRASRKELLRLEGTKGAVRCVAFSQDGKRLLSGGEDKTLRLWDVSSVTAPAQATGAGAVDVVKQGAKWRYFRGRSEPPAEWKSSGFDDAKWEEGSSGFGYSSSADELATVGTKLDDMMNGYLSVYARTKFKVEDPARVERLTLRVLVDDAMVAYLNGKEVGRDNIDGSPPAHDAVAKTSHEALAVEIDLLQQKGLLVAGENVLAVQGHNHELESSDLVLTPTVSGVLKSKDDKPPPPPKLDLAALEGAGGEILACAFAPDGTGLAAASAEGAIHVWASADGAAKRLEQKDLGAITFLDAGHLAAASAGGVKVWNLQAGTVERTIEGPGGKVTALALSADRSQLAVGAEDKTVRLYESASGKELKSFTGNGGAVTCLAVSADGKTIVSGGADRTVRVFSVETGKEIRKFEAAAPVRSVASATGDRYYSAGGSNEALEWRVVSADATLTLSGHGGPVHCVAFSPDGALVASGSNDKSVKLWTRGNGKEARSIAAHESTIYVLAFSPDGGLLATGGLDRAVKIWKTADGTQQKKLEGHGEGVFCLRFSGDGQFLYSGSSDRTVRKWNVADGSQAAVFEGHPGWVCGLALYPGDTRLESIDYGGNIISWSLTDGKRLARRKLPTVVYDFALSPDGKRVATANLSGEAFVIEAGAP